jgi:AraC-like DNA-binding protein
VVLLETGYLKHNRRWRFPSVFSPFWRLYYDLTPGHKVVVAADEAALGPDRIVLIPPHVLFHCVGDPPVPTVWLHFACAQHLAPEQPIPVQLPTSAAERAHLRGIIELYDHDSQRAEQPERERIFRLSLALLLAVAARRDLHWAEAPPEWLARALRHIDRHFAEPLYVRALANLAAKNEADFRREFLRHAGKTPVQYIREVRVREAAHLLLAAEELTCAEIAQRTGFPGETYFSRVFLEVTGQSPLHFRRLRRPES